MSPRTNLHVAGHLGVRLPASPPHRSLDNNCQSSGSSPSGSESTFIGKIREILPKVTVDWRMNMYPHCEQDENQGGGGGGGADGEVFVASLSITHYGMHLIMEVMSLWT